MMNNKTKLSLAVLAALVVPAQLMAANIGLGGSISAWKASDSDSQSGVDSLHLKVAESINNTTKINIVANVEDGFYINEGYVTFTKPLNALGINYDVKGLEVVAGQKLVSFGIDNTRYTEDRAYIGRTEAVNQLLGDGYVAKELEVSYTLPTALPVKLTAAYGADSVTNVDGEQTSSRTKPTSFRAALAQKNYSVGASFLTYENGDENDSLLGLDATYKMALGMGELNLEAEVLSFTAGNDNQEDRTGYYLYAGYDWKNSWTTGLLYDAVTAEEDGGDDYSSLGLVVSRKLSDAARLRLQYSMNNNDENDSLVKAQVVFNLK